MAITTFLPYLFDFFFDINIICYGDKEWKLNKDILYLKVKYQWKSVYLIHNRIYILCREKGIDPITANAITMAATELMENAVKYGRSLPDCKEIEFLFTKEEYSTVKIAVTNGVVSDDHMQKFLLHLQQLRDTENPEALFTERVLELMDKPDCSSGQLGLFRIAYEGSFTIDYEYVNDRLTIIARRNMPKNFF